MSEPTPTGARAAEAFGANADPSAYVPRLALEAALAELAEVIGKPRGCAALSGDTGLGKTLVLKVMRERQRGSFECLYLPFPRLSPLELWRWAALALGLGAGEDDRGAVLGRAQRLGDEGSGLVLLVDDAGALPALTRADLLAALDSEGFSLVLAFNNLDLPQLESLPAFARRVELGPPMTLAETRAYVHARLRGVDPDGSLTTRLTPDRLAALHDAAGGVPARLHPLLDAWLRTEGEGTAPPRERRDEEAPRPMAPARPAAVLPPLVLPAALEAWRRRLALPAVRLSLLALVLAATLGAWFFAWQRGPGVASVGVPVTPLAAPRSAPQPPSLAPAPADPVDDTDVAAEPPPEEPLAPEPEAAPDAPDPAEVTTPDDSTPTSTGPSPSSDRTAARAQAPARWLAPALPLVPPAPDPSRAELPVQVSSLRFPDEHVPANLEPEPLSAPPAGPRLSVNARPWAAISLDGTAVGETPLGELRVSPGAHVVSAKLPDGRVVERTVETHAGDVYVVFP